MEGCEGAATPRRSSHGTPESMRLIGSIVSGMGRAACLERTKSKNVEMTASVAWQRESSGAIAVAGVAEGEEGLRTAGPRHGPERTPEDMPVVKRNSGERGKEESNG